MVKSLFDYIIVNLFLLKRKNSYSAKYNDVL